MSAAQLSGAWGSGGAPRPALPGGCLSSKAPSMPPRSSSDALEPLHRFSGRQFATSSPHPSSRPAVPMPAPVPRKQCRGTLLVTRHCPAEMRDRSSWCAGRRACASAPFAGRRSADGARATAAARSCGPLQHVVPSAHSQQRQQRSAAGAGVAQQRQRPRRRRGQPPAPHAVRTCRANSRRRAHASAPRCLNPPRAADQFAVAKKLGGGYASTVHLAIDKATGIQVRAARGGVQSSQRPARSGRRRQRAQSAGGGGGRRRRRHQCSNPPASAAGTGNPVCKSAVCIQRAAARRRRQLAGHLLMAPSQTMDPRCCSPTRRLP